MPDENESRMEPEEEAELVAETPEEAPEADEETVEEEHQHSEPTLIGHLVTQDNVTTPGEQHTHTAEGVSVHGGEA